MRLKCSAILLLIMSWVSSLAQNDYSRSPLYVSEVQMSWVNSIMNDMTIDEKIGQLFAIDAFSNGNNANEKNVEYLIKKYHIGGVIFFEGNPLKQVELTNKYQSLSKIPLLIAMDAEWGVSMRLRNTPRLPLQMVIAASNKVENSYYVSEVIANECKRLGVHMSYSPVADVNINPKNPVIGRRSFGEDNKVVASFSVSSLDAYRNNGILACAKHFPGHGDTSKDSHKTLPNVNADIDRIKDVELYPFEKLIRNNLPAVMVAHLRIPAIEPDLNLPSSLSSKVIDSLLKKEMNYKGLVLSDALNMVGAQTYGTNEEVNIQAFKAGNDVLLYPMGISKTVKKFKEEIANGNISVERLDESVRKILMAKYWANLGNYKPVDTNNLLEDLNSQNSIDVIRKVTRESFTLIKNKNETLPIVDVESPIAHVVFGGDKFSELSKRLNDYGNINSYRISSKNFLKVKSLVDKSSTLIISIDNPFYSSRRNPAVFKKRIKELRNQIDDLADGRKVVLNLIGNPYSLKELGKDENFDAILVSYKNTKISQEYAAATIFGANSPKGVLPVSINEKYKIGTSLSYSEIGRLSYSTPDLEGMSFEVLNEIDSIVNKAISNTIMPGAQVLVARNGKIVYNKSFGYKTYKKKDKIKNNYLYDVASLTKILATTPIVMKMVDMGKIDMEVPVKKYLPELDTTSKANLTLRKMMAHYARLQPWIPFYKETLDKNGHADKKKYYSLNYNSEHKLKVANNLYLRTDYKDSIYYKVLHSKLRDTLEYKYSDLPYYFLQKIVEDKQRSTLDKLAEEWFYRPLGMQRIAYKPKNKYSLEEIVPSEVDNYFRQRILWGDVNDSGAAMMGGVAGHAGVFANAYDVAVIMQMYLQEGYYGGKRYFNPKTIDNFTKCHYCSRDNRRGLGFDKPQLVGGGTSCDCVSFLSFGHSGFTGTLAWADPDEKIVYIFLSNRTYPVSTNVKLAEKNIRTDIQSVIYKSIKHAKK